MVSLIAGFALLVGAFAAMRRDVRRFGCAWALAAGILLVAHGCASAWSTFAPSAALIEGSIALSPASTQLAGIVFAAYALLAVLGVFLIINGIVFSVRCGPSRARIAPVGFGLVCLVPLVALASWMLRTPDAPSLAFVLQANPVLRFTIDVTLYVPFVFAAYALYSLIYAHLPKHGPYDYLIVLGAGLRGDRPTLPLAYRLEAALRIYEHGDPHPVVIVSGGQGPDEVISESSAMQTYLVDRGMPEGAIVQESRSTSTRENIRYSKELMDAKGAAYSGVVVTNNFHALRAAILARRCGLDFQCIGCGTKRSYLPAAAIREAAIFAVEYRGLAALYVVISGALIALQTCAPAVASLL